MKAEEEEEAWVQVEVLKRLEDGSLRRKKGVYSVKVCVTYAEDEKKVSLKLARSTVEGKDRMLSVTTEPIALSDTRLGLENDNILSFADMRDALACTSALKSALRNKKKFVDVNDPRVQAYAASLLVDPEFLHFVQDLGTFYSKLRKVTPSPGAEGSRLTTLGGGPRREDAGC